MTFILKKISQYSNGYTTYNNSVWVYEEDLKGLGIDRLPRSPFYVHVISKQKGNPFTFFAKLSLQNKSNAYEKGVMCVPQIVLDGNYINSETKAEVTIVDLKSESIKKAQTVFVKLPEELVEDWGEDESKKAGEVLPSEYPYMALNGYVYVKPGGGKDVVIGKVVAFDIQNVTNEELVSIEKAKVVFEGMPNKAQKIIDFNSIGGLDEQKKQLREIIQLPLTLKEYAKKVNLKNPKGVILYGPPGNGKTLLAQALAGSLGSHFFNIPTSEFLAMHVGEGEERLRDLFKKAERQGKSVVFIDEIDSIASARTGESSEARISLVAALLECMDGLKSKTSGDVFVIAATNRLHAIDPALRRPGRFDLEIEIPLPNLIARKDIISKKIKLNDNKFYSKDVTEQLIDELAELTNGYSGADLDMLYREACMSALRKISVFNDKGKIETCVSVEHFILCADDFYQALRVIIPTSQRGVTQTVYSTTWEQLIGVDNAKNKLISLHEKYIKYAASEKNTLRPTFVNIGIIGNTGAGKHTLVNAFAKQFEYKIVKIDFRNLNSMTKAEANYTLDTLLNKARQLSPSIVVVENVTIEIADEIKFNKILDYLHNLNKRQRIILIFLSEKVESINHYVGYKKIADLLNIDMKPEQIRIELESRFCYTGTIPSDATIGMMINQINES